jgi:hypothetical protein
MEAITNHYTLSNTARPRVMLFLVPEENYETAF